MEDQSYYPKPRIIAEMRSSAAEKPRQKHESDKEQKVLETISNLFARAAEARDNAEDEIKAATQQAARLMNLHNVENYDLERLQTAQENDGYKVGGMAKVALVPNSKGHGGPAKVVTRSRWALEIATSMSDIFACKYGYKTGGTKITFKFYGIAANADAAAEAFKACYNITMQKSMFQFGDKKSYCQGVARGLCDIAWRDRPVPQPAHFSIYGQTPSELQEKALVKVRTMALEVAEQFALDHIKLSERIGPALQYHAKDSKNYQEGYDDARKMPIRKRASEMPKNINKRFKAMDDDE